ncbi:glycosyltransferase [Amylibacter sp.]|nr:glycosyltransferase [Amylibacter sp.]
MVKNNADNKLPRVTIITAVYNGVRHIEQTIKSIIEQDYPNLEYIIIDGGSNDGTVDILKKYESKIDFWLSERDLGISDAFNKGLVRATGDYMNFQGDGDQLRKPDILSQIFKNVDPYSDILVNTLVERTYENGNTKFISKFYPVISKKKLLYRLTLPHQGLFTHKNYFEKFGNFDINNVFCMDYEILLRSYRDFPKVKTLNLIASKWRDDGIGNGRELEILREYHQIKIKNMVGPRLYLEFINTWIFFKYYFKKSLGFYVKY